MELQERNDVESRGRNGGIKGSEDDLLQDLRGGLGSYFWAPAFRGTSRIGDRAREPSHKRLKKYIDLTFTIFHR